MNANSATMSRPKLLPRTPSKINSSRADSDEEEIEEFGKKPQDTVSRPGRASKQAAASKISDQLAKENAVLN